MPTSLALPPEEQIDQQLLGFIQRVSPNADPTSILLFRHVAMANHLLRHVAEKQLESDGLSWTKFMLLLVLQGNETFGTGGGLQPSELSDLQGIPRNRVSVALADLEKHGLVSRTMHSRDRRKFLIRLTPKGRKVLKSRLGTQFRQVTKCFAAFSAEERTTLLGLLTRLNYGLSAKP